jgi:SAM-dependent methyltransferase
MNDEFSSVKAGYDRWSAVYDRDGNPLQAIEEPVVRDILGDVGGLDAIDLGCGTGRHSLRLAAAGARVTALDFSEGMLAEARAKPGANAIRFLRYDLHQPLLDFANSFDVAVSGLVLEHIRDLRRFFAEVARVLRPSGRAVISAMHPAMFLKGTQARFTDPETGELVQPGSEPHSIGEFVMAAIGAGFTIEDIVEKSPDSELAEQYPRAAKYVGWPMLIVLALKK